LEDPDDNPAILGLSFGGIIGANRGTHSGGQTLSFFEKPQKSSLN
jgi:hypothetical protein